MRVAAAGERRSRSALLQLNNVIRWISKAPGKRRIILISSGFIVTDRARTDESDLIEQAIRSEVLINVLDANGVSALTGISDAGDRSFGPTVARQGKPRQCGSDRCFRASETRWPKAREVRWSETLTISMAVCVAGRRSPNYIRARFQAGAYETGRKLPSFDGESKYKEKVDLHARRGYFAPKE